MQLAAIRRTSGSLSAAGTCVCGPDDSVGIEAAKFRRACGSEASDIVHLVRPESNSQLTVLMEWTQTLGPREREGSDSEPQESRSVEVCTR